MILGYEVSWPEAGKWHERGRTLQMGLATNSKRSAFLKAQKELKVEYPNPHHWGAFGMVGE